MKKLLTVLLAASLGSMAFADGHDFPDVPSGHWAEDAVERIAELNIVIGFPDGTFRGNEAFTRYQASLVMSRLLNIVNADMATMGARLSAVESAVSDASDIAAIENDVAAVGVAVDAAQSTADANAAEIAALNQIMQLLGDQVEELQSDTSAADAISALEGSVADLAGDVANIREFVILLRRDQVAVRDRVADLEGSVASLEPAVSDLADRVTALETNPLGFNGSISLSYIETASGGAGDFFDIDRAYGVGLTESMGASAFSTGAKDNDGDKNTTDAGERAQDRADIGTEVGDTGATVYGSDFSSTISISLGGDLAFGSESTPRGLNSFAASAVFELEAIDIDQDGTNEYVFGFDSFATTFEAIGAGVVTVDFGAEVAVDFTAYTLSAEQPGLAASIGAPDMLAFLDPALHVAYLTTDEDEGALTGSTLAIRGTMSAIEGFTGGVSYINTVTANLNDLDTANDTQTTYGVDGAGSIDLAGLELSLAGEYAAFMDSTDADAAMAIYFVEGGVTVADILGGVTISGNYRAIDEDWDLGDDGSYEYDADQTGFGVTAEVGLLIADLTAFYDSYTVNSTSVASNGLGVAVSADLFAGFSIAGSYELANTGGAVVDSNDAADTGYSVTLSHDGAAADALIANLNLSAGYEAASEGFNVTTISAAADYSATVSILTLTPYVSYELVTDGDDADNNGSVLKGGLGVVTEALDVMFAPSLEAAVNYVSESYTTLDYTASQLQWSVGLNLGEFLLPNTTLSARYGSYGSTNWTLANMSAGAADGTDPAAVSGFEVQLNFYDLVFDYGMYTFDPDTATADDQTSATAFGVSYKVGF